MCSMWYICVPICAYVQYVVHLCTYMCICAVSGTFVYLYVHMCSMWYICVPICAYVQYVQVNVCVYDQHVCVCMYACVSVQYVCLYVCLYVCVCMFS